MIRFFIGCICVLSRRNLNIYPVIIAAIYDTVFFFRKNGYRIVTIFGILLYGFRISLNSVNNILSHQFNLRVIIRTYGNNSTCILSFIYICFLFIGSCNGRNIFVFGCFFLYILFNLLIASEFMSYKGH